MGRMITACFVWPGMRVDIASWCRDCVACQRVKVTKQPRASVQPIPIPFRRFSHVHIDLVGPLPASEDRYMYIMTIVDQTTRWLEAVPLKNISASGRLEAFLCSWVARFGVPETLILDRGTQFASAAWASFCSRLRTKHVMTTAYHPQANSLVERTHRQLKDALWAREAGVNWPAHLPWVLFWAQVGSQGGQRHILSGGCFWAASSVARGAVPNSGGISHGFPGGVSLCGASGHEPASHVHRGCFWASGFAPSAG
jgi:hypothetical protein